MNFSDELQYLRKTIYCGAAQPSLVYLGLRGESVSDDRRLGAQHRAVDAVGRRIVVEIENGAGFVDRLVRQAL